MIMEIGQETILAKCYIYERNNEENICYLSKDNLFVKNKGILSHFPLDSIMNISFKQKILLMPIIFGGIMAPLALIALFNGLYSVWLMLSLMMGGLALLYYGIEGGNTLSVQTNVKEYDFFLRSVSPNLKSFVSFVINYQHRGDEALIYYFTLPHKTWKEAEEQGYVHLDTPLVLSSQRLKLEEGFVLLAINIAETNSQVTYTMDPHLNKLMPTIEKRVSVSDIIIPDK